MAFFSKVAALSLCFSLSLDLCNCDYGTTATTATQSYPVQSTSSAAYGNSPPEGAEVVKLLPQNPFDIKGDDVDKGGEVSKACRFDEPAWSDCDPFEMIRHRTLHLVSGGRQCDEVKNLTKHCTPYELPPGTNWLIEEHRKCIAELKRLKIMIADLSKYISTLKDKGQDLFNAYLTLKRHWDEVNNQVETLQRELRSGGESIANIRKELEEWKANARNLQNELDQLKTKFYDLQKEHKQGGIRLNQCERDGKRCASEIEGKQKTLRDLKNENSELKRRLMGAKKYKEDLKGVNFEIARSEAKVEKIRDKIEILDGRISTCRIELMKAKNMHGVKDEGKDTKLDLKMEMWITHNKSEGVHYSTEAYTYPTTSVYHLPAKASTNKCLISYYGVTNETCWYRSNAESAEADFEDTLGRHTVEAHWKYFTIDARDQYECDKAAHLHYEFLLNRCQPKHHLPVLSIFRPDTDAKELGTHIYPKPNIPQPGQRNRCWITFLGPHGHCERRKDKYPLYNSDDTLEGYQYSGSGESKSKCLSRSQVWSDYCETPVIATYLPEGLSSNWKDGDIQHDNHGGRMFEEMSDVEKKINAESINPHNVQRPENSEPDQYEDTPEFRQSLNMKGREREELLKRLRERLGMLQTGASVTKGTNENVKWASTATNGTTYRSTKPKYGERR